MKKLGILLFLFYSINLSAQTFTSTRDGNYTTNNTWSGGTAPSTTINSGVTIIINHNVTFNNNIDVKGGGLTINPGKSLTGNKDLKVRAGGTFNANGLITVKKFDVEDVGTVVTINDSIFADGDVKLKDGATLVLNGNSVFDKDFDIEDNSTLTANGTLLVEGELKAKDNSTVTLNGDFRTNDKLKVEDNTNFTINGNAYIDGDAEFKDNVEITIGPSSIVQITDELKNKDNSELTINGALIAENGKENKDDGIINGTGLFQVDGGFTNDGTISGSLDVCSADGSTNPISGNGVSGGATVCSSGGINFPIIPAAPLPVDLVSFEATLSENNYVELLWITASEINNDFFTIEKANENEFFEEVKTLPGAGNTNVTQVYKMVDEEKCEGICYYRLKQTDFDGKTTTYDAVGVVVENKDLNLHEVKLYPNPLTGNQVTIELPVSENQEVNFFVNDLLGRAFVSDITMIDRGDYSMVILEFNQKLPKGIYLISMIVNKEIISKKLYVE